MELGLRVRAAGLLALGLLIAGCAGPAPSGSGGSTHSAIGTLTRATFPACAQEGFQVATYLLEGRPETLDPLYASLRAQILQEPKAARGGLIRAEADKIIEICDSQEQAQVEAQASASASAAASATQANQFQAGCSAVGGTVVGSVYGPVCTVSYPGYPNQQVPLNSNGSMDQGDYAANEADCAADLQSEQIDARDGFPWASLPIFHSKTGVCTPGSGG